MFFENIEINAVIGTKYSYFGSFLLCTNVLIRFDVINVSSNQ